MKTVSKSVEASFNPGVSTATTLAPPSIEITLNGYTAKEARELLADFAENAQDAIIELHQGRGGATRNRRRHPHRRRCQGLAASSTAATGYNYLEENPLRRFTLAERGLDFNS